MSVAESVIILRGSHPYVPFHRVTMEMDTVARLEGGTSQWVSIAGPYTIASEYDHPRLIRLLWDMEGRPITPSSVRRAGSTFSVLVAPDGKSVEIFRKKAECRELAI